MAEYNLDTFIIKPRGEFNSSYSYRYLDLVTYNGSSYICINKDTIDGTAIVGIAPEGMGSSSSYWQCVARKGDKGDDSVDNIYPSYKTIEDGIWDYSQTDKIIIPENGFDTLNINNVYDGCCGVIVTKKDLNLPDNSDYSIDYDYIIIDSADQYYMYTFIYGKNLITGDDERYIWNRTIIKS